MATIAWTNDPRIERTARRRVAARIGWMTHAGVFVLVNLLLLGLAAGSGQRFPLTGMLGWGFGLAMHGLVVLVYSSGVMERLVRQERTRLIAQRDPW